MKWPNKIRRHHLALLAASAIGIGAVTTQLNRTESTDSGPIVTTCPYKVLANESYRTIAVKLGVPELALAQANRVNSTATPGVNDKPGTNRCIFVPEVVSPPVTTTTTTSTTQATTTTVPATTTTLPASSYGNDKWLFVGDSITANAINSSVATAVKTADPTRNPTIINVAVGGTLAITWADTDPALGDINAVLAASDARFVPLALGTNDYEPAFKANYEILIQRVLAAGRIPVLPYMPWLNNTPGVGKELLINAHIEALLVKYPTARRGPNLYSVTVNRPDLFPAGDVHPNAAGQQVLRDAWVQNMLGQVTPPPPTTTTTTTVPATTTTQPPATTTTTMVMPPTTVPGGSNTPLAPIADNFTVTNELVQPYPLPGFGAGEGAFRTECAWSHMAFDDPIVYPNEPGKSHLHTFFGNRGANAASTYASLRTTGESTCAGGKLNRSGYWIPAMFDGNLDVRTFENTTVYYKCSWVPTTQCSNFQELPPGMKIIAGYDSAAPNDTENPKHYKWRCTDPAGNERAGTSGTVMPTCNIGEHLYAAITFPNCWNGVNIDSANHRDHMAYPGYSTGTLACPGTHQVKVPTITLQLHWIVSGTSTATWKLASDTSTRGLTFHADWFGAWSPPIMTAWMNGCVKPIADCVFSQIGMYQGQGSLLRQQTSYTGPKILPQPAR